MEEWIYSYEVKEGLKRLRLFPHCRLVFPCARHSNSVSLMPASYIRTVMVLTSSGLMYSAYFSDFREDGTKKSSQTNGVIWGGEIPQAWEDIFFTHQCPSI